jgi:hypothetical protein
MRIRVRVSVRDGLQEGWVRMRIRVSMRVRVSMGVRMRVKDED